MHPALARLRILVPIAFLVAATSASAQVLDLTINNTGLAIGDKPRVNGVRINFRDRQLEEVNGVNITIWNPYSPATGVVNGLALGIPVTGAKDINGIATGILGAGADRSIHGIGIAPLGLGAGGDVRGIMIGGIGVGGGGSMTGLAIGGVGVGSGGAVRGIQIGGVGVGSGGSLTGLSIGGIGVGSAGAVKGIAIGGIGVGGGSSFTGIGIGGVGVGAGGDATGLMIGGVGVGSGGTLKGLAIGGVGVGAPNVQGVLVSPIAAGGQHVHAIVVAGAYFKVDRDGRFDGGALSSVNHIKGAQHGLTIGLFNYARELHGAQIGLINISDNEGHRRVLPILSAR
ncbi:MAG TPA: hypothetical protein VLN49_07240 [Gemmatimonadaceae bacterium]|nr:hypothetical protein [Gemmatimonadaceae bacterium]